MLTVIPSVKKIFLNKKNKKEENKDSTLQKDKLIFFRSRNAGIEEKYEKHIPEWQK